MDAGGGVGVGGGVGRWINHEEIDYHHDASFSAMATHYTVLEYGSLAGSFATLLAGSLDLT